MKLLPLLCLGCALAALLGGSLRAEDDDPPRKRGGFTGATPTPAPKKKTASESTPAPKKKRKLAEEDAPAEKKSDTPAKRSKTSDAEKKDAPPLSESTPAPKKKHKLADEDLPAEKKTDVPAKRFRTSDAEEKAAPPADESTPAPKRKHKLSEEDAPAEKKTDPSEAPSKQSKASEAEEKTTPPGKSEHAPAATLEPNELAEFSTLPPRTQALITAALELTKLNLTYTYGSDDPAQGGMDCSGTIAHVLRAQGFKDVPRDSSGQYVWARKGGPFFVVVSKSAESFEFKDLQPGDLLFWTGTYETGREIPISHVMLYLGIEKKTKKRVMFGSSDGRSYAGIQRWGVSVFDFKMPNATAASGEKAKVDFVGYGRIPGLRDAVTSEPVAEKPPSTPAPVVAADPTPKPRSSTTAAASSSGSRKKKRSD